MTATRLWPIIMVTLLTSCSHPPDSELIDKFTKHRNAFDTLRTMLEADNDIICVQPKSYFTAQARYHSLYAASIHLSEAGGWSIADSFPGPEQSESATSVRIFLRGGCSCLPFQASAQLSIVPQMCVKPGKLKVSGFPSPRSCRRSAANSPNSSSRVASPHPRGLRRVTRGRRKSLPLSAYSSFICTSSPVSRRTKRSSNGVIPSLELIDYKLGSAANGRMPGGVVDGETAEATTARSIRVGGGVEAVPRTSSRP